MRSTGHVVHMGETRNVCRILVVKPGGKGLLVKSGLRWKGNTEAGLEGIVSITGSNVQSNTTWATCFDSLRNHRQALSKIHRSIT